MTQDWRFDASCRDVDPEIFFPVSAKPEFAREALAICATCPVREQCLSWALEIGADGVWGGTTDEQRRDLRRGLDVPARVAA
jgi:WhiB family redox-sensing transcriptional regulator